MPAYRLYSNLSDHETILELWGGSTKHPDSKFFFSDFAPCCFIDPQEQIVPWIFECASKLNFPVHAYMLSQWACEIYEGYRGWE